MKKSELAVYSTKLPSELVKRLRIAAITLDIYAQDIVRQALIAWLDAHE